MPDESELSDTVLFGSEGSRSGWADEHIATDAVGDERSKPDEVHTNAHDSVPPAHNSNAPTRIPDFPAYVGSTLLSPSEWTKLLCRRWLTVTRCLLQSVPQQAAPGDPGMGHTLSDDAARQPRRTYAHEIKTGKEMHGDLGDEGEWQEVAREEMLQEQLRGTCKVAALEHCLAEGGRERVRLQLLLQTTGGRSEELDVQARPRLPVCLLRSTRPTPARLWPTPALACPRNSAAHHSSKMLWRSAYLAAFCCTSVAARCHCVPRRSSLSISVEGPWRGPVAGRALCQCALTSHAWCGTVVVAG